jgi:hypothetical protein
VGEKVGEKLTENQELIIKLIKENPFLSKKELGVKLGEMFACIPSNKRT